jgi:hypothetical protein
VRCGRANLSKGGGRASARQTSSQELTSSWLDRDFLLAFAAVAVQSFYHIHVHSGGQAIVTG